MRAPNLRNRKNRNEQAKKRRSQIHQLTTQAQETNIFSSDPNLQVSTVSVPGPKRQRPRRFVEYRTLLAPRRAFLYKTPMRTVEEQARKKARPKERRRKKRRRRKEEDKKKKRKRRTEERKNTQTETVTTYYPTNYLLSLPQDSYVLAHLVKTT